MATEGEISSAETERARSFRYGVIIARAAMVFSWILLVLIALELWTRFDAAGGRAGNPYILAWTAGKPWPFHDLDPSAYGPRTAPPQTEAAPAPETLWTERIAWFAGLPEPLREEFARACNLCAFALDDGMRVRRAYPSLDRLRTYFSSSLETGMDIRAAFPDGSALLERMFAGNSSEARIAPFSISPGLSCQAIFARGPANGDIFYLLLRPQDGAPEEPWWEIPGFSYAPHTARKDSPFFLNNRGFRGSDIAVPKPAGIRRLLFAGGSTTEEGPINDFTYPALTGRLLKTRYGVDGVETVNCGVSGTTTFHHLSKLASYLALEPDMLIFYAGTNDIVKRLFPEWIENARPAARLARQSLLLRRYFPGSVLPPETRMREDIRAVTIANLDFITARAKERGIRIAVCSFAHPTPAMLTSAERAYYEATRFDFDGMNPAAADAASSAMSFGAYLRAVDLLNEEIRAFCERTGTLYIPVAETLRGGAIVFGDICHMKNYGIMEKAECVARAIAPLLRQ